MNLSDLIERAKKACPGWAPPRVEVGLSVIVGTGVKDRQHAAIILASIKEWMVAHQPNVPVEFTLEA